MQVTIELRTSTIFHLFENSQKLRNFNFQGEVETKKVLPNPYHQSGDSGYIMSQDDSLMLLACCSLLPMMAACCVCGAENNFENPHRNSAMTSPLFEAFCPASAAQIAQSSKHHD